MFDSIIYGTEISTAESMYDTELPLFESDYSNLIDKSLDLQVAKTFKDMSPTLIKVKKILSIILDIKSNVKMKCL